MKTIGFIGLGLIGGSIAKAIRKYHEDYRLLAYDQDRETLAAAVSSNMIDAVCEEHDERFRSCDYIFLCAPVEFNVKYLEYFKDNIGPDTILTDVGSVKGIIHKEVERLGMESRFIGGHPMAGSEKTGFEASSDRLIENAYYIITPGGEVALERLTDFTEMISSLGAIPMVLTSEEHDFITAGVSHLPHIIASALVNLVNMLDSDQEYMKTIAAGGFRDITRIASSSPIMWEQICVENNQNISNVLDDYIRLLVQIKCFVDNKDSRSLYQMFASSRDYRDSIDVVDNGLLKKAYVLYLDIADEAGGIATIATILAMEKISIKNIGIIHNREFEEGVLKIEFYDGISTGVVSFRGKVTEGMSVGSGTPLVTISSNNIADGDPVQRARIAYEVSKKEYERMKALVKNKIVSDKEFAQAEQNYENARISYEALSKNHSAIGQNITDSPDANCRNTSVLPLF